ncbi:NACHT domain-containing protein [Pseudomonas capsici]|uniref:NACHT domain-containing protein n=1 Tax=Pseudomonas capsici TaxID=2810614 RepID=UPI00403B154A
MPDFSLAISLLKKPIDELFLVSDGDVKAKLSTIRTAAKAKMLHKKLYETQRVKTIWHTDRPLSLSSFFYPVQIVRNDPVPPPAIRLKNLDPFKDNHNIIFGTVGQGKSILMRYLLGGEIKTGTRIPIFVELRHVDGKTLRAFLAEKFSNLMGIAVDTELFCLFATAGKLSLLLDGFDEVEPGNVSQLMQEIEEMSFDFPDCKMVLTSRPDSNCKHLTNFHSYRIQPLELNDLGGFYKKITKDKAFSGRIYSAIKSSPTKIRELITTPLLATLLAISYRSAQKIPLGFAEFYNDLFQILLIRHDASKLGWRRHRKSKVDDRQIQQIFEAFCFSTRKRQLNSIDYEAAYDMAVNSIKEVGIDAEPQSFLDDIKKITCLLIEEGNKLSFVHASVQEFFAARYIKTRTDMVARRFYSQVLEKKWQQWNEELVFLKQIDSHRAMKYFFMPDIEKARKYLSDGEDTLKKSAVRKYLSGLTVVRRKANQTSYKFWVEKVRGEDETFYSLHQFDTQVFAKMFSSSPSLPHWNAGFMKNPSCDQRSYLEISEDRGVEFASDVIIYVERLYVELVTGLVRMQGLLEKHEEASDFMDIT